MHDGVRRRSRPAHVDVMMEKELAVNLEHKRAIEAAANHTAYKMVHDQNAIGDIRNIVVHDSHRGPKEIGYTEHFLTYLTDHVPN